MNAMQWLRDVPIGRKLTIITMLTSGIALLVAGLSFVTYEHVTFREQAVTDLATTAEIVAHNSSAALTFNDPDSAAQTLKSIGVHKTITGAVIYRASGEVFASYRRPGSTGRFDIPPRERDGHRFGPDNLQLFHTIMLAGEPAGTVYIDSDLSEVHARVRRYLVVMILVMTGAAAVAWVLARVLRVVIVEPVLQLEEAVRAVTAEQNYAVRAPKAGDDELGRLIDGFNTMLSQIQTQDAALQAEVAERTHAQEQLERVHKRLMDASRQAGMAEIATNVLHNVGNVLNSVNVSATLAADLAQKSSASGLGRVVTLMREHEAHLGEFVTSDARGRHLLPHLGNLAQHLATEQALIIKELDSLRANVEHIRDIVSMQQSYAKVSGVSEIVRAVDLVEDGLRMNAGALSRHNVEVVRDFRSEPLVNVDKHKVLQILVNLVRNAKYACEESGRADRRVILRVMSENGRARIGVIDNGVGIAPENLTRIFNHGFTTRASGHGFGLHGGALAARELGGSLIVRSGGRGQGAEFILDLPEHRTELAHA